jgi:triacylglycerol lipase
LENSLLVSVFDSLEPLEKDLGSNFSAELAPLISSASPPAFLDSLYGLTVTESQEDGMPVYDLTPSDPSGDYVVALHGGAFIDQPSIVNWLAYDQMAHETGATIVVPIYPLATDGGTAGTVDPEIASLISSEIAAEGTGNVSVYGDSAGGEIALEAVEQLARAGDPVPHSMVLDSPALDLSLTNPNIAFVNDPILGNAGVLQDDELWAGGQSLTDPEVSPSAGWWTGFRRRTSTPDRMTCSHLTC